MIKQELEGEVGNIYSAHNCDEETLVAVETLTVDIRNAYRKCIENSELLSEGDRRECLEKIDNIGQFINRASGATVSGYPNISNGNYAVNGDWTNTNQYAEWENSDGSSIIIDLGAEYPIDYIKIWHYYGDNRTYYHSILSVGTELTPENEPLETIVWENGDNEGWVETSAGRVSPWIQGL